MPAPLPSHAILQEAADWFAALRSPGGTERDRQKLQAWLDQREEHRVAWRYVEEISQRFAPLHGDVADQAAMGALKAVRKRQRHRRQVIAGIGAAGLVSMLGWQAWRQGSLQRWTLAHLADHRTRVGEVRALTLSDGTQVWLNTDSAINVRYSAAVRDVELVTGEILVQTAHDATRPFIVGAGMARMTALGTRFTVRYATDSTYLAVFDGRVALDIGGRRQIINTGEQVAVGADGVWQVDQASRAREAWANGVLLAEDIPLGSLLTELGRYMPGHLGASPEAAALRVVGGFPLRDPEQVLSLITRVLPVRVVQTFPWWTTVEIRASR
ncbi:FecR domain-containing protein [Achromobacter aloeverae]